MFELFCIRTIAIKRVVSLAKLCFIREDTENGIRTRARYPLKDGQRASRRRTVFCNCGKKQGHCIFERPLICIRSVYELKISQVSQSSCAAPYKTLFCATLPRQATPHLRPFSNLRIVANPCSCSASTPPFE